MTLFESAAEAPDPAAGSDASVRVRMTVAYDGGDFHGFWPNDGVRTVGGTLIEAIERVLGRPIRLACAGRTDAGVHAWGQVVSFDAPADRFDAERLETSVNAMCGPEISVRDAAVVADDFDARHSALARAYRYTIVNRPYPDPFLASTAWHVPTPLDLRALRLARDPIIGEHDFSSFCRRPKGEPEASLSRRVLDAQWHDLGEGVIRFDISANAFCHQMVRSVVATLVDVGRGRLRAGDITGILRARDRQATSGPAPPHGLMLWEVTYP
ncbi:MAG: tRNA pseudouridine(38-40) synthase TruA [Actinomycetota bacterium]